MSLAGGWVADLTRIEKEQTALAAARDRTLVAELRKNGIVLPENGTENLKPQVMRLKAASPAGGVSARESALRTEEVNRILREEPPRRAVTGSFRTD